MNIWVPKFKILEAELASNCKLEGFYTIRKTTAAGVVTQELTFPNLITNTGLNRLGTMSNSNWALYCYLSTGTTPPAITDTKMTVTPPIQTAGSSGSISSNVGPDKYVKATAKRVFTFGTATGTWSEIGMGFGTSAGAADNYLFSHSLILDGLGNPTTITVLASEQLTVDYEFRVYPPLAGGSGTFTLTGGGTYDYAWKPVYTTGWTALINTNTSYALGAGISDVYGSTVAGATFSWPSPEAQDPTVSSGSLQHGSHGGSMTNNAYVANSFQNTNNGATFDTTRGNFTSGIGALRQTPTSGAGVQCMFGYTLTPKIMKTSSNTVTFYSKMSWARR